VNAVAIMPKGAPLTSHPPYQAVLSGVRHGSHLCAFYETEDDLLDLVIPFCAAGSSRGELCVWMMPDGLSERAAGARARQALAESGMELHSGREFYLRGPRFEREPVERFWDEKLQEALAHRHAGLCASGDTWWLQQRDWRAFLDYEKELNHVIAGKPIALLCTYPFSVCKAGDLFEVARAHHVALAKRQDEWAVIEAPLTENKSAALDAANRVLSLSPRERQVLDGVADGLSSKVIAFNLGISIRTVDVHRARMLKRLGVRTMAEAVNLSNLVRGFE
jgi:DNA-binding CsgD family transcriptional regulator